MTILYLLYFLVAVIALLVIYSVLQIKMTGMSIKDFWTFIEANQMLDKLFVFANKYDQLSVQEQLIFLTEAEKIFDAFSKVPDLLWEEEYQKYIEVLNRYKDIKMLRWAAN